MAGNNQRKEKVVSNTRKWRAKDRTTKPNSRQKRNGLFLDEQPDCGECGKPSKEAHSDLPDGHPDRHDWRHIKALCRDCHVEVHRQPNEWAARRLLSFPATLLRSIVLINGRWIDLVLSIPPKDAHDVAATDTPYSIGTS